MSDDRSMQAAAWEASPLAILTLDKAGLVQSANPAAERIFSIGQATLQSTPLTRYAHGLDCGALQLMLDEVRAGRVPTRQEIRFETPHRGEVATGLSLAPSAEHAGWSIAVLRDLTKEKTFRPQLLHTERMATMGSIASVVAHELNNALAGALGCVDVAIQQPRDAESLLQTVRSELLRASLIVMDLKEYARADEGLSDHIDIPKLCARLSRLHGFHDSNVDFSLDVAEGMPRLRGNANQLIQALLNLVSNAEHAAASNRLGEQPRVRLSAAKLADVVHIDVADNGCGVPAKERVAIFDPFYSTKPAGEGTGLGLAVVQAVAAAHSGRVEILDTPGGGATFRLILPVSEFGEQSRIDESVVAERGLAGVRLLIAEDEAAIRSFMQRALGQWGAEATVVEDAGQAIDIVQREDFDIVVLDVRMPGGGGVEAYRRIVDSKPNLASRIVFMTGELSAEMAEIVGQDYACVLQKPFTLESLRRAIQKALD